MRTKLLLLVVVTIILQFISFTSVLANEQDKLKPELLDLSVSNNRDNVENYIKSDEMIGITLRSNENLKISELLRVGKDNRYFKSMDDLRVWSNSLYLQDVNEGYYYPQLKLWDLSNNVKVINPSDYKDNLRHLAFKIDKTLPDQPEVDISNWATDWSQGGISSRHKFPQINRFGQGLVTASKKITIKGFSEKNQRVELFVNEKKFITEVSDNNCKDRSEDILTRDGLITKYGSVCSFQFDYYFHDDGSNNIDGSPTHKYEISVRTLDKAGNRSESVDLPVLFHDEDKPEIIMGSI